MKKNEENEENEDEEGGYFKFYEGLRWNDE